MTAECHELTQRADGMTELAYLGAKPWHGLGQVLPENASIEQTAKAAGMDWSIQRSAVTFSAPVIDGFTGEPSIDTMTVPNRDVLWRSDNYRTLGVVSKGFHEVQPMDALEFFRDMTEAGGYQMETAGTMRGGARLFAAVKVRDDFDLGGGDRVAPRLLFATACDGTMSTTIKPISIRVVCRNTLRIALHGHQQSITVRHNTRVNPSDVKARLATFDKAFAAFYAASALMTQVAVSSKRAEYFMKRMLPAPAVGPVEETRAYKSILRLFDGAGLGADMPTSRGTMWGLLNAVTQYVDHETRAWNEENRQESAIFGAGDALKARALATALATM
jgi:phage/plasmid-like protein (TIGR03299 family)